MKIIVADERILLLKEQISDEQAEKIASNNKGNAFGSIQKLSNFLIRPKDDEFTLLNRECRYIPFWHIVCTSKYVYDRTVEHHWPAKGPEVHTLTLQGSRYKVENGKVTISVVEHCKEEQHEELFVDGLTSIKDPAFNSYIKFSSETLQKVDIEKLAEKNVVLPPNMRASVLVREIAGRMIRKIDADQIFEESVEFQHVDLYYRKVYAHHFKWISKDKEAVVEVDAYTGAVTSSQGNFQELVGKVFDYDFLFDIGKDAAGTFIPGGSIAVKIAKRYMDVTKKK